MTIEELLADPKAIVAAAAFGASAFSTAHTFLDKHPRLQASLKIAAHFVGPLNLPAMKGAIISLARAIVAAEDKTQESPGVTALASIQAAKPADGAKVWPQS